MIQFYGAQASSSGRTHLMLEECSVPYEYHKVNPRDPAQRASYLQINPGGKVPFLIDGDLRMRESIAINFYLAEKYAPQLWATSIEERAQLYMWSLWAITNLQPASIDVMRHTMQLPAEKRHADLAEAGKHATQRYLDELESHLGEHVALGRFSVADVNVGSIVNLADRVGAGKLGPKTAAWLSALRARPAWQRAAAQG